MARAYGERKYQLNEELENTFYPLTGGPVPLRDTAPYDIDLTESSCGRVCQPGERIPGLSGGLHPTLGCYLWASVRPEKTSSSMLSRTA